MKRLKNILGFIDWSNFSYPNDNYKLPETVSLLVLRTLFSILLLPFTWYVHIINLFKVKSFLKYKENAISSINGWIGMLLFALASIMVYVQIPDGVSFSVLQFYIVTLLVLFSFVILFFLVIFFFGIAYVIGTLFHYFYVKIKDKLTKNSKKINWD